ncbi:MAG TPA: hypothetical protein QGI62_00260 [Anaerolineales bacterium]|jgi:predicted DNA-binding protein|nr:hypothetical protein [Anaerolineales bacterium]
MKRTRSFAMRLSTTERRMLTALAARLQRTKSDAVRWLIGQAVKAVKIEPAPETQPPEGRAT